MLIDRTLKATYHITTYKTIEGLIKAVLTKNPEYERYYIADVCGSLNYAYVHRLTNTLPSKSTILKHTFKLYEPTIHMIIEQVICDSGLEINFNSSYLIALIIDYFYWLAGKLSTTGGVTFSEVKDEIKDLKRNYNFY